MALQTPIARARGLGSARMGTEHFKIQRLTSIASVPLVLWFVFAASALSGSDYLAVRAWLASPVSAALMILLIITVFWHAQLGVQVVIEDYVHQPALRTAALVANNLIMFGLAITCIVAVMIVAAGI